MHQDMREGCSPKAEGRLTGKLRKRASWLALAVLHGLLLVLA